MDLLYCSIASSESTPLSCRGIIAAGDLQEQCAARAGGAPAAPQAAAQGAGGTGASTHSQRRPTTGSLVSSHRTEVVFLDFGVVTMTFLPSDDIPVAFQL